jgi:sulfite dehydrogenase (quinone) subunit SoeC
MHPAPSVIVFTVLSGLGFGFLTLLGIGLVAPAGWAAFGLWGLAYGLAVAGLLASTFHLGHPERAWRALTQWRSSWLSREGVAALATLLVLAPVALSDWLGLGWPRALGWAGAALALVTVFTTSMIYAQLKTVPRWHHWLTSASFLGFALAGGAVLAGQGWGAVGLLLALGGVMRAQWRVGDGRFAAVGATMGSATGLGALGQVTVFEQPHSHPNYLMREMIHVVGRKHAAKLRLIALGLAALLPALLLALLPAHPATTALAALSHLTGAIAQRWLFFAEAEHVVGLYYGKR